MKKPIHPGDEICHYPSDGDPCLYHWRAKDLWKAAKGLPVKSIRISSLGCMDSVWWFKHQKPTLGALAEHMKRALLVDSTKPIILAPNGHVLDGGHRILRAVVTGRKTIEAVQFKMLPPVTAVPRSKAH